MEILPAEVWPINGAGEIIFQLGQGDGSVVGYQAYHDIPTDSTTNKVVVAFPELKDIQDRTSAGWNDLTGDMSVDAGSPNAPTLSQFRGGIYLYEFVPDTSNEVRYFFHIRHDYLVGSMLYPHIHFSTMSSASGNVRWGFEYTLARRHVSTGQIAFPLTQIIYVDQQVDANSEFTHFVSEATEGCGIPGTQVEPDVIIMMRVFRDATSMEDTFPGSVHGITVDLHYQANRDNTPSRFPPFI